MAENINNNKSETGVDSVEVPLNTHRATINETTLVSNILNIVSNENIIIALGQGNRTVLLLMDRLCEKQAFPYLLPMGKLGYNSPRDVFQ